MSMAVVALAAESNLRSAEARLGVRFPRSFRNAVLEQRAPAAGSRYILLALDEIRTTHALAMPGDGVVVARTIGGGYVVLEFDGDSAERPRTLKDAPRLWEPDGEPEDADGGDPNHNECSTSDGLVRVGDSFDDILEPSKFERTRVCPHCNSELGHSDRCDVCGQRRDARVAGDPDRDVADSMVRALVESGGLVTRSAAATSRIIYATTAILHDIDDDAAAATAIIEMWEDAAEVEEVFATPEELATVYLAARG